MKTLPIVPNFPELENYWLKKWQQNKTVAKYLKKNQDSKKRFSFFDGPITANNPMGVHHGWGRTYKDLWQRFHNLLGYSLRFQNGFDCQGLWVEVEVEKELKLRSKKDIENLVPNNPHASIAKFVDLCKQRVIKYSSIQRQQSQRLGYFMDWDNSYFTMAPENNFMIWHFLKVCNQRGWIYKGKESVPWCPRCQTAISQHEMLTEDYKEVVHEAIYLQLPLEKYPDEFLLVWTTTPWTIPANIAVAVDPKLEYSLVQDDTNAKFWIAKDLVEKVFGNRSQKIIKTVKGQALLGLKYHAPFDDLPAVKTVTKKYIDKFHLVVASDEQILPINLTEGTGLVHTAFSAGTEYFKLGQKLGLPMIPVIGDNADYLPNLGFLSGENAKKHPRLILDYLEKIDQKDQAKGGWVFKIEKYRHRYPACWRCKTELVWKVESEWYIAMDKGSPTLREQMIQTTKQIKWLPHFGLDRELDWLKNMHDWLISKKNRYWGLALPIYECQKCRHFQVLGSETELENKAVKGWDRFTGHSPHKPWIDEVEIKCDQCGQTVKRIADVGNPWLDAGIIPFSTLIDPKTKKISYLTDKKYWQEWFPADFITESFPGQFKNWFYSLIAMSTVLVKSPSFKTILGYATCVGKDGRAMHKSWGNSIEFNEAAEKIGVDVMRWMYAKQDPAKNLWFGYEAANETKRNFHIPLWNILKFYSLYANLEKYEEQITNDLSKLKLPLLDSWLLSRLKQTERQVYQNLKQYQPNIAAQALESLVLDASQWYLRLSRNRVWQNSTDKNDKLAFYSTLHYFLKNLTIMLSVFLPFFSEEIFTNLFPQAASVHLQNWPEIDEKWLNTDLVDDMQKVRNLAELGHIERKKNLLKVRQPLGKIEYQLSPVDLPKLKTNFTNYQSLLSTELNLKEVLFKAEAKTKAKLDTKMTPELVWEGKVRDLIREIQKRRSQTQCRIDQQIDLCIPEVPAKYLDFIKNKVLARNITFSKDQSIEIRP
ncbi:hypothetical protein A2262_00920 [Candidatus Roizmanbacteria bacterium RIFOXYA2_FULL_41_8]|nr:MAG: hypothetical protein A2262_00920 [Candidatus Roizmanbacteria bacterium RIFOXYA2_FULL_41_8]